MSPGRRLPLHISHIDGSLQCGGNFLVTSYNLQYIYTIFTKEISNDFINVKGHCILAPRRFHQKPLRLTFGAPRNLRGLQN